MKKSIAVLLTVLLMTLMVTPAFAAEPQFMKAEQLSDEALLMMAKLNVDQRSDAVKAVSKIHATASVQGLTRASGIDAEVYVVTLLEDRQVLADGKIVETYSTTAVSSPLSHTESQISQAGAVYARINYEYVIELDEMRVKMIDSDHKIVTQNSTANSMYVTNSIYRNYNTGENENSRTISNPSNNSWYTLYAKNTSSFPRANTITGCETTGYFGSGGSVYVECLVEV